MKIIGLVALGGIIWILAFCGIAGIINYYFPVPHHKCNSPCTVHFPKGTQEDDFKFDYSNHQLKVWVKNAQSN